MCQYRVPTIANNSLVSSFLHLKFSAHREADVNKKKVNQKKPAINAEVTFPTCCRQKKKMKKKILRWDIKSVCLSANPPLIAKKNQHHMSANRKQTQKVECVCTEAFLPQNTRQRSPNGILRLLGNINKHDCQ